MIRALVRTSVALLALTVAAAPAQAQYSFVGTRAAIGGSGLIDWASLGPELTLVDNPTAGIVVQGTSLTATVSQPSEPAFFTATQGSAWGGNFAPGSALLWNNGGGPAVTLMFSGPVSAAGAHFQVNEFGAFTGSIDALDAMQNVLATFVFGGTSNGDGDGSAPFAGVSSALSDIYGIRFTGLTTAQSNPNDFAIDNVSVNVGTNVVPEPSTYALMVTGLLGLGAVARRTRSV